MYLPSDGVMVNCLSVKKFGTFQINSTKLGMYIVYHKLSVLQENWRLSLYGEN